MEPLACPGGGPLWVSPYAVGTAGNFGLPSRGPISWEEMGKEPQREEVLPLDSLSGGVVWGRLYFLRDTRPAALTAKGR